MSKKKLWLVRREVWAETIEKALKGRGRVFDVQEYKTDESPSGEKLRSLGFKKK